MSSTVEGSGGWAREDALDLGQANEELQPQRTDHEPVHINGDYKKETNEGESASVGGEGDPSVVGEHGLPAEEKEEAAPFPADALVEDDVPPPSQPKGVPGTAGSIDGTASTPDDTPSLHVCRDLFPCLSFVWFRHFSGHCISYVS